MTTITIEYPNGQKRTVLVHKDQVVTVKVREK